MQNYARFVVLQFCCLVRCNMCWFGVAVLPAFVMIVVFLLG